MAFISDTRKSFQFAIDLEGVPQMTVQKISGLEAELETVAHGEIDRDIHTPGRIKFGEITLERVLPLVGYANEMWNWLQSARFGGSTAKKTFTIRQLASDNITTVATWQVIGTFPKKVSIGELSRVSSDNTMETVILAPPDDIIRLF